jgi:hypothetical protein
VLQAVARRPQLSWGHGQTVIGGIPHHLFTFVNIGHQLVTSSTVVRSFSFGVMHLLLFFCQVAFKFDVCELIICFAWNRSQARSKQAASQFSLSDNKLCRFLDAVELFNGHGCLMISASLSLCQPDSHPFANSPSIRSSAIPCLTRPRQSDDKIERAREVTVPRKQAQHVVADDTMFCNRNQTQAQQTQ